MTIAGVVLAGGASRRMGGPEKALLAVGGVSMLARITQSLASQCAPVVVSITGDPARFTAQAYEIVVDNKNLGPMAGLAVALDWLANEYPAVSHVLSAPCDTPFLPNDLVTRLSGALKSDTFAACAASGGRLHPVIGLWPLPSRHMLLEAVAHGILSFHAVLEGKQVERVEWEIHERDPFFNINTPEHLAYAERLWK